MSKAKPARRDHTVRIIAGRWRGRRLLVAPSKTLRPTPDRVRETLFNWLTPTIPGARCLDLYAGTGALGFEALSRGAAHAVFVEREGRLAASLRRAAQRLAAESTIVHARAEDFLERTRERFDVVFLDPPYETDPTATLSRVLARHLEPNGVVYVERSSRAGLEALAATGGLLKRARAGGVYFGLVQPGAHPEDGSPRADC